MQRRSSYASVKRRKAFAHSFQKFHTRCFCKIRHIKAVDVVLQEESLDCLDLAVGTSDCSRKWRKSIKLQILRCLPPYGAEYLIPEAALPKYSMVESEFRKFNEYLEESLAIFQRARQRFENALCSSFEKQILNISNSIFNRFQKKKLLRIYFKLVDLFNIFNLESSANHFPLLYQSLLVTLCHDFPKDSELALGMMRWLMLLCVDDGSRSSVFLEVEDCKYFEYLFSCARDMSFDFWGLWRGIGDLSAGFNPVAELFGYARNTLARTLLKYGFQYSALGMVYEDRCQSLLFQRYHNMPIIDREGIRRLEQKSPRDRMLMTLDIFVTFADFELTFDISDAISTLVYISRSLPHPYISSRELYHNLKDVLQPTFNQQFIRICTKYSSEEIYDDDYKWYKPRKLTHLSRCVVRRALVQNLSFPTGIDELNLGEPLRAYLLLER